MDALIRHFNERWFQGWGVTPEEQKIKFLNIASSIEVHTDFKLKYQENTDSHNSTLAFEKILKEVMLDRRKEELELYKLFASDEAFKISLTQSLQETVGKQG